MSDQHDTETMINGKTLPQLLAEVEDRKRQRAIQVINEIPEAIAKVRQAWAGAIALRNAGIPFRHYTDQVYVTCNVGDLQRIRKAIGGLKLSYRDVDCTTGGITVNLVGTDNPSVHIGYPTTLRPNSKCKVREEIRKVLVCDR